VYVVASDEAMVFYKFNSLLNLKASKLLKATGTTGGMYANSVNNYKDVSLIFIFGGTW
jgi:hypothetical protein